MKILSTETNLGSATNVSNAPVVRLFNSGSSNILVTRKDYNAVVVGSFMVPSGEVVYAEKYFTDTLEGSSDVKATKTAYSSMMSFASSGSSGPTYTYSVSASSVDEGGNWTTTVTTTNVDDNTTLYWSLSGTNITSDDFSSGALTGSGTISNNTFNFSHTVAEDTLTEGTETVTIKLFTDSGRNTQVGNTVSVTLNDTSLSPTYAVTLSHTVRDEGDIITTTMTTTNVANSTELWWELSGTGIAAGDFSSGALTGSVTISSNSASFSHTIASDNTTEGTETLNIKFYSDSGRTTQVGSTVSCTINDTSIAPVGNSVYFDGTGDYLSLPSSTDFTFGTGDFTIECFVYRDPGDFFVVYDHLNHPSNKFTLFAYGNNDIRIWNNQHLTSGTIPPGNQWFHVAWVRQSGTLMFFVDGVKAPTTHSWSYSIGSGGTAGVNIGNTLYGEYGRFYLSNLRAVKGTAVYTSNFTKPTSALTNISGTVLLCCQSSSSTTAAAVAPGSGITIQGDPTASGDWVNGFSTGIVGFDGSGDYLELPNSTDFDFGSGDFTIEFWLYVTGSESIKGIIAKRTTGGAANTNFVIYVDGLQLRSWFSDGSNYFINDWSTSSDLNANSWNHVAIVRNGTTFKTYFNGTQAGSRTNVSNTIASASRPIYIGCDHPGNVYLNGYISNLRVVKGTAVYTANFTSPASELTNISGTVLLCCKSSSSAAAADVAPSTITANGDPTAQTFGPFTA